MSSTPTKTTWRTRSTTAAGSPIRRRTTRTRTAWTTPAIAEATIGAGKDCDGQVLVLQDVIGIGRTTQHTRNFLSGQRHNIPDAIAAYVRAVKSGEFPAIEHGFD